MTPQKEKKIKKSKKRGFKIKKNKKKGGGEGEDKK